MLVEDWLGCEARTRTCIRTEAGWLLAKVSTLREIRKRFVLRFGKRHSPLFFQKKGHGWKGDYAPPALKTLLLVEDDRATAFRLGETLAQQARYHVIVASDWLTALKFLHLYKPDLILLDDRLLTRHGIDLLPRLLVLKELQDIPLLFLSTDSPGS